VGTPGARLTLLTHAGAHVRRTALAVLVLPDDTAVDEPLALHGTAVPIWDLFSTPRAVEEVAAVMAERFPGTPRDEIENAVDDLARRLLDAGALVAVPGAA
jgi:hypothetical protein